MTQEEKQILLNDLKHRLYTKTQCKCTWEFPSTSGSTYVIDELHTYILEELEMIGKREAAFIDIKPYLRSMESMTIEERNELQKVLGQEWFSLVDGDIVFYADRKPGVIYLDMCDRYVNWLYEHHFDFHRLIFKGLALEAPEGMYN